MMCSNNVNVDLSTIVLVDASVVDSDMPTQDVVWECRPLIFRIEKDATPVNEDKSMQNEGK